MGQLFCKEEARLEALEEEKHNVLLLLDTLEPLATAEEVAGRPETPGSHRARARAAVEHLERLVDEELAILERQSECRTCSRTCSCRFDKACFQR